jgi:hypothetical protein
MNVKFLCLAYGDEKNWKELSKEEQDALLAQDAVVRKAGALMAGVQNQPTTLTAWDGTPSATEGPFASSKAPLAGFSVIEAADLEEVIRARERYAVRPGQGCD